MIEPVSNVAPATLSLYDAIIDVRSPAEFAEDHIPGAISLPVLSDEERAEVGAIYVQESRFRARRLGAAFVARNISHHLESELSNYDAHFRPLVYCWRGGMRSNATATILSQIGWRVGVLEGGYKAWRRAVVAALLEEASPLNIVLIDGETGSAKTELLGRLKAFGIQTIDLEALAAHRGSVFGADQTRAQPTQKSFESALFDQLRRLDSSQPIAVEAESSRIGALNIPKRIWMAMRAAPRIYVRASAPARAAYLSRAYADVIEAPGAVADAIERLSPFHAKEIIEEWRLMATEKRFAALAERLMREHYDPLYLRSRKRDEKDPVGVVELDQLDDGGIGNAAKHAADIINSFSPQ